MGKKEKTFHFKDKYYYLLGKHYNTPWTLYKAHRKYFHYEAHKYYSGLMTHIKP